MIRVNLAPPRDGRGQAAGPRLPWLNLGLVFGLAALVLALGLVRYGRSLQAEEGRLIAEVETQARQLAALKLTGGEAGKVKDRLADLRARLTAIEALERDQRRPLRLIDAFADAVPADVWITGLEDKGAGLRVAGSAFSPTAVANFMSALRASRRFKDVDITVSKRDLVKAQTLVSFEVTCRFEGER